MIDPCSSRPCGEITNATMAAMSSGSPMRAILFCFRKSS
jgi:hypothetical protein